MSALASRFGAWIAWLLPFAVVALLLGWETDWGRRLWDRPLPQTLSAPQPVEVALLPDFAIEGGVGARRETVERTLFNPTRRAAPASPQDGAKARLQRGQFVLTGTALAGTTTIAFLRETNGGKARSARPGDVINGMKVAEVRADRVTFTLGDESEEVVLRVAAGPKTTVQPAGTPPGQVVQPVPTAQPAAVPATAAAPPAGTPAPGAEQSLLERRRAARAAAAAAAAGQAPGAQPATSAPVVPNPGVPAQPAAAQQPDPRWAEIYQRMQQRGQ